MKIYIGNVYWMLFYLLVLKGIEIETYFLWNYFLSVMNDLSESRCVSKTNNILPQFVKIKW